MLVVDNDLETPLHRAARHGYLDQVPAEVLTAENLLVKNGGGETALHCAAGYGHLDQVPKSVLTVENLLVRDEDGWLPIHIATKNGHLWQVPLGLEFPDMVRELVGDDWWERNQDLLRRKAEVARAGEDEPELEIF